MALSRKLDETSPNQKNVDDPRIKELKGSATDQFYGALNGRLEHMSGFLLGSHIHPDVVVHGNIPLALACRWGNIEISEFLIMYGACLEGDRSDIPLFSALGFSKGNEECAELLVRHKADVNARNHNGYTPLMFAAHSSKSTIKLLLEHQADVHATYYGKTALDLARKFNASSEVISLFEAASKMSLRK